MSKLNFDTIEEYENYIKSCGKKSVEAYINEGLALKEVKEKFYAKNAPKTDLEKAEFNIWVQEVLGKEKPRVNEAIRVAKAFGDVDVQTSTVTPTTLLKALPLVKIYGAEEALKMIDGLNKNQVVALAKPSNNSSIKTATNTPNQTKKNTKQISKDDEKITDELSSRSLDEINELMMLAKQKAARIPLEPPVNGKSYIQIPWRFFSNDAGDILSPFHSDNDPDGKKFKRQYRYWSKLLHPDTSKVDGEHFKRMKLEYESFIENDEDDFSFDDPYNETYPVREWNDEYNKN